MWYFNQELGDERNQRCKDLKEEHGENSDKGPWGCHWLVTLLGCDRLWSRHRTGLGMQLSCPVFFLFSQQRLTQRSLQPIELSTFPGWPPLGHSPALSCALVSVHYWSLQSNPWRMGILFCSSLIGMDGKSFCQLTAAGQLLPSLGVAGSVYQGHQEQ